MRSFMGSFKAAPNRVSGCLDTVLTYNLFSIA